jgi:hypothetical protein
MAKKIKTAASGGLPRPDVTVGPADPARARIARKSVGAGGFGSRNREAGMLIDTSQVSAPYSTGYKLEAYRSSYAYGLSDRTGAYDIPTYFVQMNEQNGGMLYWPVTLHEKYSWYRYWARCIYLDDKHLGNVLMSDGTERDIRKIVAGDKVVTALGTIRPVKWTFERMCEDEAYSIEAVGCSPIKTTHHHPFYILRREKVYQSWKDGSKNGNHYRKEIKFEPEWVHAEHLKVGDHILRPMNPQLGKKSRSIGSMAAFLGFYCAEGNLCDLDGHHLIQLTVHDKELEYTQNLMAGAIASSRNKVRTYKSDVSDCAWKVKGSSKEAFALCDEHVGRGSATKRLSQEIMSLPRVNALEFLGAYFNGDGSRTNDKFSNRGELTATTTSACLASQIETLCLKHGMVCRKSGPYEQMGKGDAPFWNMSIPRKYAKILIGFSKWVATSEPKFETGGGSFISNGYLVSKIQSITHEVTKDMVYNIEVDAEGDEKSFICNGMVTHNTDAYIGRALELLSDLPMSKLTLNMPKMAEDKKELSEEILAFFTYQLEVINAFELCQNILWEMNMIGNVYIFHEWDDKKMMWSRAVMLPPEEVYVFQYPFTENKRVEYRPQRLISLIKAQGEGDSSSGTPKGDYDRSAMNEKIVEGVPHELQEMVRKEGCIVMDTDPSTGSFVHHVARRRSPYHDLGASVLERVLVPMLQKEHYRYTQLSLASRNMTPKNLITAPGLMPSELDELRTQVDLSYMDPEYSVITNYEVTWQQIGVQDRMLDFSREYEQIENQVFSALGVTRELLTGEGQFSGTKITVEILNTMFLLTREVLRNYIEKQLFIPICEAHGWFEEDKNGAKKYFYPQLGFNRLTIRDNAEVFDSLFQLYSKGSLPVEVIYELFNLNAEEMHNKLLAGMFTAKDSTFNRMTEEVNTEVGRSIVQQTDVVEKVSKYLGLKFKGPPDEGGGEAGGVQEGGGGDQEGGGVSPQTDDGTAPDNGQAEDNQESGGSDVDPDAVAKEVADALPPDASDKDIQEAIDEAGKAHGE